MQTTSKFWDKIAQRYARQPIADMTSYEHKLAKTREYFHSETRILELGCGTGSTALLHAPHVAHILATDVSQKMVEIGEHKAKEQGVTNISFEQAEADQIGLTEPVDMVMAMSLLHLVEDKDALIKQVFCWLKPGGVFVSSTVCLADSHWRHIRLIAPLARMLGLMPMFKVFSQKELTMALAHAGFNIDYAWKPEKGPAVFMVAKKPL
ncbi:class I SAM-dependent methyltransferase [Lacimicrobium sp. SS2-24]|uniref:class I SAM-dependent methyltransferase n=1 Tax=Lacimicrobium sp. SS2-24 TaxID=2005569 RepID=UPI000B4BD291|nr:class I SAM-dependent methyltransferase [Lacimicrobium sp. SS2-24]